MVLWTKIKSVFRRILDNLLNFAIHFCSGYRTLFKSGKWLYVHRKCSRSWRHQTSWLYGVVLYEWNFEIPIFAIWFESTSCGCGQVRYEQWRPSITDLRFLMKNMSFLTDDLHVLLIVVTFVISFFVFLW